MVNMCITISLSELLYMFEIFYNSKIIKNTSLHGESDICLEGYIGFTQSYCIGLY